MQKNIRVRVRIIAVSCHVIKNTMVQNTGVENPGGTLTYTSNFFHVSLYITSYRYIIIQPLSIVRRMENTADSPITNPLYWPCLLVGNHNFILRLLKYVKYAT